MKVLRSSLRLLGFNWKPLLLFELSWKLIAAALFLPLFKLGFTGAMRLAGYRYLTAENVLSFFFSPVTLLFFAATLLLITLYFMIDACTVTYLLDASRQRRKATLLPALRFSLTSCLRVFRRDQAAALPLSLTFTLMTHLSILAGLASTLRLPPVLSGWLARHAAVLLIPTAFIAGLCSLARFFCALPIQLLDHISAREARQKSALFSLRHRASDLGCLLLLQGALLLVYILTGLVILLVFGLYHRLAAPANEAYLTSAVLLCLRMVLLILGALSAPAGCAMITVLYIRRTAERGEAIPSVQLPDSSRFHPALRRAVSGLLLASALISCVLLIYRYYHGHYNLDIEHLRTTEITAHRGASVDYPENTMAAFQGAWEQGADWIELDVRQSRDGQIYVMHDGSFRRTTGLRRQSWELTWEEISRLDAGSFLSPAFGEERIPLLEDVISFAKWRGIRLNIELKPTSRDQDLIGQVIALIHEYGIEDDCVVTCQKYSALQQVKTIDPDITTVYVMSVAYGDIGRLSAADHFSIESTFITRGLVSAMHNAGKQIYAWTIDNENTIERMITLGVDNIITNNVPLGKQCVSAHSASGIIQTLIEEIIDTEAENVE